MSNRDSKGRFVKAKTFNVGDNVCGYSRVQKKWLEGKITDITLGDDIQTYELGLGNWISKRHPITLLSPLPSGAAVRPLQVGDRVSGESVCGLGKVEGKIIRMEPASYIGIMPWEIMLDKPVNGNNTTWIWRDSAFLLDKPAPRPKAEEEGLGMTVLDDTALADMDAEIAALKAKLADIQLVIRSIVLVGIDYDKALDAIERVLDRS